MKINSKFTTQHERKAGNKLSSNRQLVECFLYQNVSWDQVVNTVRKMKDLPDKISKKEETDQRVLR